ncbi:3-hydroxyacyl-CoA dehydrogenase family protein [Dankookia sp. P2]|uniref:3-hydroxyacyl-CoA dehydrogenase family protein n=1 Tax=Dankookia sp. P2 TaxID=3423955 RepID=UPI003D668069
MRRRSCRRRRRGLVTPGDIEGGLPLLAECDWIVEAIVERPEAKRALYTKLEAVRKPGSIVSSNTSTIPLAALTEGLGESFAADFLITHFFNPPRYMRLLEVVRGPATRPDALAAVTEVRRPRARQDRHSLQGPPGLYRQPDRRHVDAERHQPRLRPEADGRGSRCGYGPADGRAEDPASSACSTWSAST